MAGEVRSLLMLAAPWPAVDICLNTEESLNKNTVRVHGRQFWYSLAHDQARAIQSIQESRKPSHVAVSLTPQ